MQTITVISFSNISCTTQEDKSSRLRIKLHLSITHPNSYSMNNPWKPLLWISFTKILDTELNYSENLISTLFSLAKKRRYWRKFLSTHWSSLYKEAKVKFSSLKSCWSARIQRTAIFGLSSFKNKFAEEA